MRGRDQSAQGGPARTAACQQDHARIPRVDLRPAPCRGTPGPLGQGLARPQAPRARAEHSRTHTTVAGQKGRAAAHDRVNREVEAEDRRDTGLAAGQHEAHSAVEAIAIGEGERVLTELGGACHQRRGTARAVAQ